MVLTTVHKIIALCLFVTWAWLAGTRCCCWPPDWWQAVPLQLWGTVSLALPVWSSTRTPHRRWNGSMPEEGAHLPGFGLKGKYECAHQ